MKNFAKIFIIGIALFALFLILVIWGIIPITWSGVFAFGKSMLTLGILAIVAIIGFIVYYMFIRKGPGDGPTKGDLRKMQERANKENHA